MKTAAISRFVIVAAIAALMVVGVSTPLLAQITFTDFSNTTGLQLNGSTAPSGTALRLTATQRQQAGSVFATAKQPVAGDFSTTFSFKISDTPGDQFTFPADGIAFVIQNSPLTDGAPFGGAKALAGPGGSIGYSAGPGTTGIPNSLVVEFDTFLNGAGGNNDPDANHVAILSCGIAPNSADHNACGIAIAPTGNLFGITLADSATHTATVSYTSGKLHVILDNHDLFPSGVAFDLTTLGLDNNTAFVGFTGATGDNVENNDILSWTFTPQAQSAPVTPGGAAAVLNFNGGPGAGAYEADTQLDTNPANPGAVTVQFAPIPTDEAACEKLVQKSFPLTQCFVYKNADGMGHDSALMFELTCPSGYTSDQCGNATQKFFATVGTAFTFDKAENNGFKLLAATIGPYPGWLKGDSGVPGHPCQINPNNPNAPLFASNQISSFTVVGDPLGTTKGKSGGGGSCWVATYFTFGELPPGVKVTSPTFTTYPKGTTMQASYTCSDPKSSKAANNPTGPYLTVATCSQSQAPNNNTSNSCSSNVNGVISCTGTFDVSVKGLHLFTVTSKDSGGNVGANAVIYNVK